MLKLQANPTFRAKVRVPDPSGPAREFTGVFKHMRSSEFKAFQAAAAGRSDLETVLQILTGWDGVDAEFSPENLATLLDEFPGASFAITAAFGEALYQGRQGN